LSGATPPTAKKGQIVTGRRGTKFVHEGPYAAAVEIDWLKSEIGGWMVTLSVRA
jgi:hypothetical protein